MRHVLLALCLLLVAGCGSAAGSAASATNMPAAHHRVGETVSVPGWQITVHSAVSSPTIPGGEPINAGDVFVLFDITMQNTASTSAEASISLFYLYSNDGTKETLLAAGNPSLTGPVAAGTPIRGQVVFEVAPGGHQYLLEYVPQGTADIQAIWDISV